jgi:hypothetical protein
MMSKNKIIPHTELSHGAVLAVDGTVQCTVNDVPEKNVWKLWPTGVRCFKEPDCFGVVHMTYTENVSESEMISPFSLSISETGVGSETFLNTKR